VDDLNQPRARSDVALLRPWSSGSNCTLQETLLFPQPTSHTSDVSGPCIIDRWMLRVRPFASDALSCSRKAWLVRRPRVTLHR